MKKAVKIIFLLCLLNSALYAQQEPMTTQFQSSLLHVNPAVAGIYNRHQANVLYRNQWDKVNGAPNTLFANYSHYNRRLHGGIGVSYSYDHIGFNSEHKALVHYAFHQPVTRRFTIVLGVSAGIGMFYLKPDWVPSQTVNDPSLPVASNDEAFQLNSGLVLMGRKWKFGVSASQLNKPVYHLKNNANYNGAIHGFLFGEYKFKLDSIVFLTPAFKLYTDFTVYCHTSSLKLTIGNFWTGFNFSQQNMTNYIGGMIGYDFCRKYRVGYSYDYTTNALNNVSRGTHEVLISYLLPYSRPPRNFHELNF